jgi:hypothetical protein
MVGKRDQTTGKKREYFEINLAFRPFGFEVAHAVLPLRLVDPFASEIVTDNGADPVFPA